MPPAKRTLYEILGVGQDANSIDVGLAYEKRSKELQRAAPPEPSAEALLHEAYEVLSDPGRRAAYDASLVTAAERAAAAEQAAAPDLILESGGDAEKRKRIAWIAIAAGGVAALVVVYLALRPARLPDPQAQARPPAEAIKPEPPPPPRPLAAADILKMVVASSGQLVSVDMSGRSTPLGVALAVEPGNMVTTCHGIQAGRKLVVLLGKDTLAADLSITDETLDLCKLSVAGLAAKPLPRAEEEPRAGDKVFVSGFNAAGDPALTEGSVRKLVGSPHGNVLDISVPVAATGSGGGVFNQYGQLVGIATTPHKYGPGLNIAIPASWLSQVRSRGRSQ